MGDKWITTDAHRQFWPTCRSENHLPRRETFRFWKDQLTEEDRRSTLVVLEQPATALRQSTAALSPGEIVVIDAILDPESMQFAAAGIDNGDLVGIMDTRHRSQTMDRSTSAS
jgi:hypothetical protein